MASGLLSSRLILNGGAMDISVVNLIAGIVGGALGSVSTYWFTKKRERDTELRKEKFLHYKAFMESLSGIMDGESSPEQQQAFQVAGNNLALFAPQSVIEAVNIFREGIRLSNPTRLEDHDRLYKNCC
jgi:hypothetical protein